MIVRADELEPGDVLHMYGIKRPALRWTVEATRDGGALIVVDVVRVDDGLRSVLGLPRDRRVAVRRGDEDEARVESEALLRDVLNEVGLGSVDQRVIDQILADAYERSRAVIASDLRGLAAREALVVHDVEV